MGWLGNHFQAVEIPPGGDRPLGCGCHVSPCREVWASLCEAAEVQTAKKAQHPGTTERWAGEGSCLDVLATLENPPASQDECSHAPSATHPRQEASSTRALARGSNVPSAAHVLDAAKANELRRGLRRWGCLQVASTRAPPRTPAAGQIRIFPTDQEKRTAEKLERRPGRGG